MAAEPTADRLTVLKSTPRVRALFSTIRDVRSSRQQFVSSSDRLVYLLVEEALGLLPAVEVEVTTPCGTYLGCRIPPEESLCAVSILRAADCMLGVVRNILPSVAVGKILIQRDEDTALPHLMYSKLPAGIGSRHVLLLDPMLATGGSCIQAISNLIEHGVQPSNIIFINIVSCHEGLQAVNAAYPEVRIVTGEIDPVLNEKKYIVPGLGDFGDRYFGTDE